MSQVGDRSHQLANLVNDASRFLSHHGDTISFNALHVYHSALPFTPTETLLREVYAHELETSVKAPHGVEQEWDPTVMVMRCEAPIYSVSLSPNGQFIAATGSKSIEIRDTLIGSSVVSIDFPKPLFYISSFIDEVDVGPRLKELVQIPAIPIEGWAVKSGVVEALEHAEDIAGLAPVSGLKNVLCSLIALIDAGYNYEHDRLMHLRQLQRRIKSFTKFVIMRMKGHGLSDVPRQGLRDLKELIRRVQYRMFILVADYFQRKIEVITAACRQMLSQGKLDRFAAGTERVRAHLTWEVSISYECISDAIEQFTVNPFDNNNFTAILTRYLQERETMRPPESVVDVKRKVSETPMSQFQLRTNEI